MNLILQLSSNHKLLQNNKPSNTHRFHEFYYDTKHPNILLELPSCNLCMCRDRSSNHGIVSAFSSRKLTRLKVRYHLSLFEQETNQNHRSQLSQVLP